MLKLMRFIVLFHRNPQFSIFPKYTAGICMRQPLSRPWEMQPTRVLGARKQSHQVEKAPGLVSCATISTVVAIAGACANSGRLQTAWR